MECAHPLQHLHAGLTRNGHWLAYAAALVGFMNSCSSGSTGQPPSDAGGSKPDVGSDGGSSTMTGNDAATAADVGASDDVYVAEASIQDAGGPDAIMMCPTIYNPQVECSATCYGNCVGANGAHVGDCTFIRTTGSLTVYCTPWADAADPCGLCPP